MPRAPPVVFFVCTFVLLLCFRQVDGEAQEDQRIISNIGDVSVHRIVAIGDIHGDPEKFQRILLRAQVAQLGHKDGTEHSLDLFGGTVSGVKPRKTTIVQIGDLVDRGYDDRTALNIAFDLFDQVNMKDPNGSSHNVVLLLGNHELMNLQKQYRYVHSEGFGGFLNKILRNAAFDADGPYGKFIIDNFKTIHVEEGTLFVHAGITSDHLDNFVDEETFNERVRVDLRAGNYRSSLLNSRGPVWTRETVFNAKSADCEDLEKVLQLLHVERMVVGHTPERSGHIGVYCEGKLFAIDVGLSRWMYDGFAALEVIVVEKESSLNGPAHRQVSLWELSDTGRTLLWPKSTQLYDGEADSEDL